MATQTGVRLIKSFTYRGALEEWSNEYWFTGPPPNSDSEWAALTAGVANYEKTVYTPQVHIVEFYGYNDNADNAHHVYHNDLRVTGTPIAGTLAATATEMAGDQAGLVWWLTERLSTRGKPIYLRKYFHGGQTDPNQLDKISGAAGAAYAAFATVMGGSGGVGFGNITARGHADTIRVSSFSQWVTTRTLRRRGKRPLPK